MRCVHIVSLLQLAPVYGINDGACVLQADAMTPTTATATSPTYSSQHTYTVNAQLVTHKGCTCYK